MVRRRLIALLGIASLWLTGCGMSDDKLARVLTAPDKYSMYTCSDLATAAKGVEMRDAELRALMAQAGSGAGGQFASAVAYRPEYLKVQGELIELRRTSAEKKCGLTIGARPETVLLPPPPPPGAR